MWRWLGNFRFETLKPFPKCSKLPLGDEAFVLAWASPVFNDFVQRFDDILKQLHHCGERRVSACPPGWRQKVSTGQPCWQIPKRLPMSLSAWPTIRRKRQFPAPAQTFLPWAVIRRRRTEQGSASEPHNAWKMPWDTFPKFVFSHLSGPRPCLMPRRSPARNNVDVRLTLYFLWIFLWMVVFLTQSIVQYWSTVHTVLVLKY